MPLRLIEALNRLAALRGLPPVDVVLARHAPWWMR